MKIKDFIKKNDDLKIYELNTPNLKLGIVDNQMLRPVNNFIVTIGDAIVYDESTGEIIYIVLPNGQNYDGYELFSSKNNSVEYYNDKYTTDMSKADKELISFYLDMRAKKISEIDQEVKSLVDSTPDLDGFTNDVKLSYYVGLTKEGLKNNPEIKDADYDKYLTSMGAIKYIMVLTKVGFDESTKSGFTEEYDVFYPLNKQGYFALATYVKQDYPTYDTFEGIVYMEPEDFELLEKRQNILRKAFNLQ